MQKEDFKKNYIAPTIVGIFLIFVSLYVFQSNYDTQKEKESINSHFDQADLFCNNGQFEKAIDEYNEILKISHSRFPYEYSVAQSGIGNAYFSLAKSLSEKSVMHVVTFITDINIRALFLILHIAYCKSYSR